MKKKLFIAFLLALSACLIAACDNNNAAATDTNEPQDNTTTEQDDVKIDTAQNPDTNTQEDTGGIDSNDDTADNNPLTDTAPVDSEIDTAVTTDADTATQNNIYALGSYKVLQKDLAENAAGNALAVRIFYPEQAGTYPYINFIHGFQLKNVYYDQIITHLASYGFIVVSPQIKQSLVGGDNSIGEADKVLALIKDWIIPNLGKQTGSAVPDFTKFGLAGHSRGSKISWRMMMKTPDQFSAIMGVDPVDTNSTATSDPHAITTQLTYNHPSAVIGTEKGPTGFQACAPADSNSNGRFYPYLPTPAWHVIAGGVGHMDMIDADDLGSCGVTCSICGGGTDPQKATFRTLCGGMLAAFFKASLYGETALYNTFTNIAASPHPIIKEEHK